MKWHTKHFQKTKPTQDQLSKRRVYLFSEDSSYVSHINLLTGIRSLGKIDVLKTGTIPSFDETDSKEIKYQWNFDNKVLDGISLTSQITTGVFLSSADQFYNSSTNPNSFTI